eukprot:s1045_g13.t1
MTQTGTANPWNLYISQAEAKNEFQLPTVLFGRAQSLECPSASAEGSTAQDNIHATLVASGCKLCRRMQGTRTAGRKEPTHLKHRNPSPYQMLPSAKNTPLNFIG